jgi:CheY-like chemotaxis protein
LNTLSYKEGGLVTQGGDKRILVVDDDPNYRSAIARLLGSHGYEVSTAPDRRTAMWMIERVTPALVVSDYELNDGGTGIDLADSLRRTYGAKAPPVMVVTASTALPKATSSVVRVLPKGLADELVDAVVELVGPPDRIPED